MEVSIDHSWRHWWVFLIRGLLFIFLGIYMIAAPQGSLAALGFIFGLVIFLAGISELLHAYRTRNGRAWHLIIGLVDAVIGIVLMAHLGSSVDILRYLVGIWFVFRAFSMFSIVGRSRSWLLILGAVISLLFGLLIIFDPAFGAATLVLWTAFAFIIVGFFNVVLAFRMKGIGEHPRDPAV